MSKLLVRAFVQSKKYFTEIESFRQLLIVEDDAIISVQGI